MAAAISFILSVPGEAFNTNLALYAANSSAESASTGTSHLTISMLSNTPLCFSLLTFVYFTLQVAISQGLFYPNMGNLHSFMQCYKN
jgi:ABC-type amino acid transport system permease subunit